MTVVGLTVGISPTTGLFFLICGGVAVTDIYLTHWQLCDQTNFIVMSYSRACVLHVFVPLMRDGSSERLR